MAEYSVTSKNGQYESEWFQSLTRDIRHACVNLKSLVSAENLFFGKWNYVIENKANFTKRIAMIQEQY